MVLTLRLDSVETAALRRRAEIEHRSMQDVARQAVREYIERTSRDDLVNAVMDSELPRYAEESCPRNMASRDTEEADVERRVVDKNAVKRAAERSTRVSAKLEGRVVPQEFVRSSKVEKFVAARTRRAS